MTDPNENEVVETEETPEIPDPEMPVEELEDVDEELMKLMDKELSDGDPELEVDPEPDPDPEKAPQGEEEPEKDPEAAAAEPEKPEAEDPKKEDEPAKEEAAAPEKPSDEFGDLPEGTKEETRQRFETMKEKYDELHESHQQANDRLEIWETSREQSGASPDQLGMAFQYLEDVNSKDPAKLERAYDFMKGEMEVLGKVLGRATESFNPLDAHPDLKEEYENGELSKERALEIAGIRSRKKLGEEAAAETTAETEAATAKNQAVEDLKTLGAELRAADPFFEQKIPALTGIVKGVCRDGTDPKTWIPSIREAYAAVPNPAPAPKPKPNVPNPIRPGADGHSGTGVVKEAGNIFEHVSAGLEGL